VSFCSDPWLLLFEAVRVNKTAMMLPPEIAARFLLLVVQKNGHVERKKGARVRWKHNAAIAGVHCLRHAYVPGSG
jgi:hypothetical protein